MKNITIKLSPLQAAELAERLGTLYAFYSAYLTDMEKIISILLLRLKITIEQKMVMHGKEISLTINIETVYVIRHLRTLGYFSDIEYDNTTRMIVDKFFNKKKKKK